MDFSDKPSALVNNQQLLKNDQNPPNQPAWLTQALKQLDQRFDLFEERVSQGIEQTIGRIIHQQFDKFEELIYQRFDYGAQQLSKRLDRTMRKYSQQINQRFDQTDQLLDQTDQLLDRTDQLLDRTDQLLDQTDQLLDRTDQLVKSLIQPFDSRGANLHSTISGLTYNSRLSRRTDRIRWPQKVVNARREPLRKAPRTIKNLNQLPEEPRKLRKGQQQSIDGIIEFYGIVVSARANKAEKLREIKIFLGIDPEVN